MISASVTSTIPHFFNDVTYQGKEYIEPGKSGMYKCSGSCSFIPKYASKDKPQPKFYFRVVVRITQGNTRE